MIATFKDTTSDPIHARQRAYTRHLGEHYTIHGGSDARSGLLSLHQALGEVAELRLDALRTRRDMLRYASQGNSYYRYTPQTDIALVSPSVAFFLGSWTLTVGGAHGSDENTDERYFVSAAGSRRVTQTCYDLATRDGIVPALSLGLSVQNVLNRAPPLYAPAVATYVPYDATNYPAIGRLVSASVSMRW